MMAGIAVPENGRLATNIVHFARALSSVLQNNGHQNTLPKLLNTGFL